MKFISTPYISDFDFRCFVTYGYLAKLVLFLLVMLGYVLRLWHFLDVFFTNLLGYFISDVVQYKIFSAEVSYF